MLIQNDVIHENDPMSVILAVDDDPIILVLIKKVLQDEGYTILTATDGVEAQGVIQEHKEELAALLTDWSMPRMNGIDLLRWTKQQAQLEHLPVILQTALDKPENIREGVDAGAFYYLVKPFRKELLRSIVRAAVDDHQYKSGLLRKLKEGEALFRLLESGVFRFRTPAEGEALAVRIANLSKKPEEATILAELLLNAVEHGNLRISYDEKTALLESATWRKEVERRLALPENADKHVQVRFQRSATTLEVEIQDQGEGFAFERFLTMDEKRVFDNHGRGIAIANKQLQLQFIGSGNTVRVTIPTA